VYSDSNTSVTTKWIVRECYFVWSYGNRYFNWEITTISTDILTNINTTSIEDQSGNVLSSIIVNGSNIEDLNIITIFQGVLTDGTRSTATLVNDTSGGTDFWFHRQSTKTDIATDQILMSIVVLKDASGIYITTVTDARGIETITYSESPLYAFTRPVGFLYPMVWHLSNLVTLLAWICTQRASLAVV
jgi:hypothetical protein